MTEFRKLPLQRLPERVERESAEAKYWRGFQVKAKTKMSGHPTFINFSLSVPHMFAVSCSSSVHVFKPDSTVPMKTLSRFKETAYGGSFRKDGQLLVAGSEDGMVQAFSLVLRDMLKKFKGHLAGVRATRFGPDGTKIWSGSDDKTVKLWDLTSPDALKTFSGHGDYIRALEPSPVEGDLCISGGYDHAVRLWDSRQKDCVKMWEVDSPVETVCFLPGSQLFGAGAGSTIHVFDIAAKSSSLVSFVAHQRAITALFVDGLGEKLISTGLDGMVKVYSLQSYETLFGMKISSPVLAGGLSADNHTLALGLADCNIVIKARTETSKEAPDINSEFTIRSGAKRKRDVYAGTREWFERGADAQPDLGDVLVPAERYQKLKKYDRMLKRFEYGRALDAALKTDNAIVVVSMMQELLRREGLRQAIGIFNENTIVSVLAFLRKHILNPLFAPVLMETTHVVLDHYSSLVLVSGKHSELADEILARMRNAVAQEVDFQDDLLDLHGKIELVQHNSRHTT